MIALCSALQSYYSIPTIRNRKRHRKALQVAQHIRQLAPTWATAPMDGCDRTDLGMSLEIYAQACLPVAICKCFDSH